MTPLPELTPANEWFWTSGEDGVLRIQQCADCGELVHPPVPICPYCRSRSAKPAPVSGRGTVVGLHRELPPLAAGLRPTVRRRQRRTGRGLPGPPDDEHRRVRPLRRPHRPGGRRPVRATRGRVAAAVRADRVPRPGRPGRATRATAPPLAAGGRALRASRRSQRHRAVEDRAPAHGRSPVAGRRRLPRGGGGRRAHAGGHRRAVDLPRRRRHGDERGWTQRHRGGTADPPDLDQRRRRPPRVREARSSRPPWRWPAGLCRHVLCFRTVWESTYADPGGTWRGRRGPAASGSPARSGEWRAPFGAMSAANWIAMNANQYMHRYGAPREMLGLIAVNARTNAGEEPGRHLPGAHDDGRLPVGASHHVAVRSLRLRRALRRVHRRDRVRLRRSPDDLPRPAVRIEAVGTQILERVSWDQGTLTHEPQVLGQAAHLWTRTDVRQSEVDLALVYDGFTFNAISWIEGLGFCGFGEAWDWLDGGRRIALDGDAAGQPARWATLRRADTRFRVRLRSRAPAAARCR